MQSKLQLAAQLWAVSQLLWELSVLLVPLLILLSVAAALVVVSGFLSTTLSETHWPSLEWLRQSLVARLAVHKQLPPNPATLSARGPLQVPEQPVAQEPSLLGLERRYPL
jgi:hypothetical protein